MMVDEVTENARKEWMSQILSENDQVQMGETMEDLKENFNE